MSLANYIRRSQVPGNLFGCMSFGLVKTAEILHYHSCEAAGLTTPGMVATPGNKNAAVLQVHHMQITADVFLTPWKTGNLFSAMSTKKHCVL